MVLPQIFVGGQPLIVRIEQVDGEWQIQPSMDDTIVVGGRNTTHRAVVEKRRDDIDQIVKNDWQARRAGSAPLLPRYKTEPHVPIILVAGERVQFKCQHGFAIWIDRDPDVTVVSGQPRNPLAGMTLPEVAGGGVSQVRTVLATTQRFYKCTAYVDLNGDTAVIDPDCIIDF